jgi:2-alkyl-3-oxoalkanoate reductase
MRVFVAGAAGAIGQHLIPALIAEGHEVTGTSRSQASAERIRRQGATAVIVDGLDRQGLADAVVAAAPEVIIHEMTALTSVTNYRKFDREFAVTNELRTKGTDYLLEAAAKAGTKRFIAQSYTNWPNIREGGPVKTEDDPLDPRPPKGARQSLAAIRHVETAVPAAGGLVLRYGSFYGPGASTVMLDILRQRKFPIVGGGTGIWSFAEITDAAAATVAAVTRGGPGVYNIVDDDPAPVSEWLPYLAGCLGVKPPARVPTWLGRLLAGDVVVAQMTDTRGSSNAKAKRELGWTPGYPSWRKGFPEWVRAADGH